MQTKNFVAVALLGGATPALAHMQIMFPAPIFSRFNPSTPAGNDVISKISSNYHSPLSSRAEFPCKGLLSSVTLGEGPAVSQTTWVAGQAANFTITGADPTRTDNAFHLGGSCQASLSYDNGQTFKVIKSFIGGCPLNGGISSYDITIPADAPVQNNVLFAWTWFNHVGNAEIYMNCAVVDIAGGSSKRDVEEAQVEKRDTAFSARPDIFVANIPGDTGCVTRSNSVNGDVVFPQPGPDVVRNTDSPIDINSALCGAGSGSGSGSGDTTTSTATSASAAATPTSIGGGAFVTVDPGSPAPTEATSGTATSEAAVEPTTSKVTAEPTTLVISKTTATTSAAATTTSAGSATPTSGIGSGTSSAFAAGTECTDEGTWNCVSGTSFQRCASGKWSVVMDLASGATCSAGVSDSLVMFRKRGGPRIMADF